MKAYDEIFEFTARCHQKAIAKFGQCPIVVIGYHGPNWSWGAHIKEKEEGIDLGDPIEDGVQYFGNFYFKIDGRKYEQHDSIFVVNMKRSLLEHAHLLLHELTHYFHDCIGERRTPKLTQATGTLKTLKS